MEGSGGNGLRARMRRLADSLRGPAAPRRSSGGPRAAGEGWEDAAAKFLRKRGLKILEQNVATRFGEIDIVAEDSGVLVFVEVKHRRTDDFGGPAAAIGRRKRGKLAAAASEYIARRKAARRPCRFDAVLVRGVAGEAEFTHVQDAFENPLR